MVNFRYGSHLYWHIDYKDAILMILLLHTGHSAPCTSSEHKKLCASVSLCLMYSCLCAPRIKHYALTSNFQTLIS